jgi:hypothetical protein
MNYSLYLIGLFVVLLIVYLIIRIRESNLPVVKVEAFGHESSKIQFNKKHNDRIIEQKIAHKNIAFYTYWLSLIISFGLGCFTVFKLILNMDFKLLHDALLISAGVASTVGFRKLYLKCDKDLNNLY